MPEPTRCSWAGTEPLMGAYHDDEWGGPAHDDAELFELLTLEGAQAGLSWRTILNKREGYRAAFAGFDPARVATFTECDVERLLGDAGIVRHRGKIESAIRNAQQALALRVEFGSPAGARWGLAAAARSPRPQRVTLRTLRARGIPPEATALAKDLKRRGWTFVGPTTVHAFM